jgi:hypothetical protein
MMSLSIPIWMAAHYDTAIPPARPRRPRDKARVEVAVLIIERWLLDRLRHRRFYSLAKLNTAISELLRRLNDERPIRRLGVTRRTLFEELDRPISSRSRQNPIALLSGDIVGIRSGPVTIDQATFCTKL